METNTQNVVELLNNINVTSGSDESPVSAHQLQNMLATFMTAMQAENAMFTSNLESKLNKLSENLDAKLALVSEILDANFNSMISNVTAEIRRRNDQIRQEFSNQLQTEVQLIIK
jgi:CRISPR/Cas system CMR subunit Cmr6 (Cas7 group RAMP superfamily)